VIRTRSREDGLLVIDIDEEVDAGDSGEDYSGWWCIETGPWPCGACGWVANHATAMHLIVVFPEKDDPQLLDLANECKEIGRDPKIVEYEISFGPAISYYQWEAHGRPIHR